MEKKSGVAAKRSWLEKEATFFCAFRKDFKPFYIPAAMRSLNGMTESGVEYLQLSNGDVAANSHGSTGGYSIRLPDSVEAQASGHHIVMKIVARAANASASRFALAYSTNDVGNTGWKWFTSTINWSIYTMEWDVPVMKNGNGDFLGILPNVDGSPGTEFCYLAIAVV